MSNTDSKYFDLHTTGVGYLNRARIVSVKRGAPFLAVDINALHGASDAPEHTRFDCRVSGEEAIRLITEHKDLISERDGAGRSSHKILCGFRIGDLYVDTFTYEKGEKAGQTGVSLKARLLKVLWLKVDGELVYTAPAADRPGAEDESNASRQAAA